MRNKLLLVLALTVMLGVPSAYADQISLGDSCTGTLSVVGTVDPTVTGPLTNCRATFELGANTTIVSPWSLSANGTGFAIGSGSNTLSGTIDWDFAGTAGPITTIVGNLLVGTVTGFDGAYAQGHLYPIDIEIITRTGYVSGGEIPVPEPGTLTLLGTGLITMAGFLRRKLGR